MSDQSQNQGVLAQVVGAIKKDAREALKKALRGKVTDYRKAQAAADAKPKPRFAGDVRLPRSNMTLRGEVRHQLTGKHQTNLELLFTLKLECGM